jgi:glycosyltransferase involved in cell wall biosynthesis
MKVRMYPTVKSFGNSESGIKRVVEAYERYLPDHGIEVIGDDNQPIDMVAIHAGAAMPYPLDVPLVAHTHGLYWTADYQASSWEWRANASVIESIRYASRVTVPSHWVAETLQRDMRLDPIVLPHGIEVGDWDHDYEHEGYALWNKNRTGDVCDPAPVGDLASVFQNVSFVTTFAPRKITPNVHVTGLLDHEKMKRIIQKAGVYLSTTKETFGIGVLEALASGVPVLGYDHGGNQDLIEHGVNGYLARAKDTEDLIRGMAYCMKHRSILSQNAKITARKWSWKKVIELIAEIYRDASVSEPPTVGIVIPSYNYADQVGRAIESAVKQDYEHIPMIVVVDDGSDDDGETERVVKGMIDEYSTKDRRIIYHRQTNQGVANARNNGIRLCNTKYVACLDADDAIDPRFVRACIPDLESNPSLGIAYTGLYAIQPDGNEGLSPWPDDYDYDKQLRRQNQVPTCCVFRKEMWRRLGGYKQKYAPMGAGSEDAEFWLRAGAYGWDAKKVTTAGLFIYSWQSGRVSGNPDYREVDWLSYHPWAKDGDHPFASLATPKHISHPVRQYDEPVVSVVIPVGEGHEKNLMEALDSLEAQNERRWEVIVVHDSNSTAAHKLLDEILVAYPYVRLVRTNGKYGAGYARNRGAEIARARLLLFLDADDNLFPNALDEMINTWQANHAIVYTDYVGKATINPEEAEKYQERGVLLHYDAKTNDAVIRHRAADFDCSRAVEQPTREMYLWNLITSLVPKAWHDEIGGFDENMESWEDWDYWIRMARHGKCFVHLTDPLVVYRFYTGNRRHAGLQVAKSLIEYLRSKYDKDGVIMPCNCSGKKVSIGSNPRATIASQARQVTNTQDLQDNDMVRIIYDSPKRGGHKVIGASTGINYGYRSGGDRFFVHENDIAAMPNLFRNIQSHVDAPVQHQEIAPPVVIESTKPSDAPVAVVNDIPEKEIQAPPAPSVLSETFPTTPLNEDTPPPQPKDIRLERPSVDLVGNFDLQSLPGITPEIEEQLIERSWHTADILRGISAEQLTEIKGIGEKRAKTIIAFVNES